MAPFDIAHSDIWGIAPTLNRLSFKYYVTFIDNHTRYTWICFLRKKIELFSTFQNFYNLINTQFNKSIKTIHSNSGEEYISDKLSTFLSEKECPHTPQQNGVVERKNRHILECVRAFLLESMVPETFGVRQPNLQLT